MSIISEIKQLEILHRDWLLALGREHFVSLDGHKEAQRESKEARERYMRMLNAVFKRELQYPNEIR